MSKRYPGGLITKNPNINPTPEGGASGIWTLDQAILYQQLGIWPSATDPYFNQTTLLLHGDGTNGAQNNTFLDSSTNNFTITRNGNTTQGTFSPFSADEGKWSNYFDGTGDSLSIANAPALDLDADFTIEAWIYPTSLPNTYNTIVITCDNATSAGGIGVWAMSTGEINIGEFVTTTAIITTSGFGLALNQWTHISVTRSGSTITLYKNGVSFTTATNSGNFASSTPTVIGNSSSANTTFFGYISGVRIIKGTALAPDITQPATAVSGTSLLTCQSNRFVDNSSNAFAITRNGDVKVTPFSPFAPSAAYSASVNGGSGYFDGSGDYLSVPPSLTLSGDLTCEFWTNVNAFGGSNAVVWISTNALDGFQISCGSTGTFEFYGNGSSQLSASVSTSKFIGNWAHVALVRSGTTLSLYLSGSRIATATYSTSLSISTLYIGSQGAGSNHLLNGYMSGIRIINGSGPYDATQTTITVPTAPPTAITNTQFLLNYTNAGIFDNTGKNNLETVGNAQIDTTTKKWGTGSLEFDGTGDYLIAPSSPNTTLNGDFTVEGWIYITTLGDLYYLFGIGDDATSTGISLFITAGGKPRVLTNGGYAAEGSDGDVSAATWTHVALVRSGSTITIYIDGSSVDTGTVSATLSGTLYVNAENYSGTVYVGVAGFTDDLRITKGVARYTTTFTPPGGPFQNS